MSDQIRDELEQLAHHRNTTVSDVLRGAIDGLLGRDVDLPRAEVPRSLDIVQRRTLALLHEILARLEPDPNIGEPHALRITMLEGGFTTEYPREFVGIEAELSPAECTLVMDLLDMFTVLQTALRKLDDAAVADMGDSARHVLTFSGFDYQDAQESRMARFAEYLIANDKWKNLAHLFDEDGQCPNSHTRMVERYRRLLRAYEAVLAGRRGAGLDGFEVYQLGADDLQKVLAEARRRSDLPQW